MGEEILFFLNIYVADTGFVTTLTVTELQSFKGFCNFLLYSFRDSSTFEIINLQRTSVSPRVYIKPACVLATCRSEFRALSWLTSISEDVRGTLPTLSLRYSVFVISYHFIPCKTQWFFPPTFPAAVCQNSTLNYVNMLSPTPRQE